MTHILSHQHSPLELTRKSPRVRAAASQRQFSEKDQAALAAILHGKYETMYDKSFEGEDAFARLFDDAIDVALPDTTWYHPVMLRSENRGSRITSVLLTSAQERVLFLQFNYCRHRVLALRAEINPALIDHTQAKLMLGWHHRVEAFREQIAGTNLALVLAMAKRTHISGVEFGDLVSEGNMALLRAADKFDAARGFKFSTYACRAILKSYSRMAIKSGKTRAMFPAAFDPKLEKSDFAEKQRALHEDECVEEVTRMIVNNKAMLSDIERAVIAHRFSVGVCKTAETGEKPMTLEQVGKVIGVTKERARQIQNKALGKMKRALEAGFLR